MMTVIMGMAAMVFLVMLIYQDASREYSNAQYHRRDDTVVVGAEAMLERYAAKLTIDPRYYQNWVDEAEMPRRCADPTSPNHNLIVSPGNAWFVECTEWTYEDGTGFSHPLLDGDTARTVDDITALLAVVPPGPSDAGIYITVVSDFGEFGQTRALTASIKPQSISEFAFLVESNLTFGSGAVISGKIYVGGDLNFSPGPPQGIVHRNVFAEGQIGNRSGYGPPIFQSGSVGHTGGGVGGYADIRTVYPDPIDFNGFWEDLELIRQVACGAGGLCLSHTENPGLGLSSNPTAWLLQPYVAGSASKITVSAAYSNNSYSCVTSEEWWWLNSQNASWTTVGTFDVPDNGAVWVDGHAVIGMPGDTSMIDESFTIFAGAIGSRKNIIMASDIEYLTGVSGSTVLGLIASDEIFINPYAVGSDDEFHYSAALLAQDGNLHTARMCGSSGDPVWFAEGWPKPELNTNGSAAKRSTGGMSSSFAPRNYGFDQRLEYLRPPLFPLLGDAWEYVEWREQPLPCWAIPGSC
jgi:hypothetical protein